jgi:hypothetical protein
VHIIFAAVFRLHILSRGLIMITIDDESRGYFKEKLSQNQALRVFFGGYG